MNFNDITLNDIFLILIWVTGIIGIGFAFVNARSKIRAEAKLMLDKASFEAAQDIILLLRSQLKEIREEMKLMRETWQGEMRALKMRETKLLNRIKTLEATLLTNGILIPLNGEDL